MKGLFNVVVLSFCLLFIVACQKEETEKAEIFYGHAYAPLKVGQQKIFRIDSIIFNEFSGQKDTLMFFQKATIVDSYQSEDKQRIFRLKIEERFSDSLPWHEKRMDKLFRNDIRYEQTTENVAKIALIFPIAANISWNANALNSDNELQYTYQNVNQSFSFNGKNYDSTLTVLQKQEDNLIEKQLTEEKYASNVGLFFRKDINLRTTFSGDTLSGYICQWTLLE